MIEAEPRMFAVEDGICGWLEAVDDAGRSLVPPGYEQPRRNTPDGSVGSLAMTESVFGAGHRIAASQSLRAPTGPGRTLKRLRGSMPVLLAMREPGPLEVPLGQDRGDEVRDDRVAIAIGAGRPGRSRQWPFATVELTIRAIGTEPLTARLLPLQIDVLDAQGTRFKFGAMHAELRRDEVRLHLNLSSTARPTRPKGENPPSSEGKGPVKLLFYHVSRMPADVDFTFEDLPLP
jgi:hypothetical protein